MSSARINIFSDPTAVSRAAADALIAFGKQAIEKNGRFTIALAGGSTPRTLYQLLTGEEYRQQLDWAQVFFFFGDERDVSPASVQSNFKMAQETLFKPLNISKKNIFRWPTEILDAVETAERYEQTIRKFFDLGPAEFPQFDLILLGMGDDGHTASLFPQTEALTETRRIAVANRVKQLNSFRLTLTLPVINNGSQVIFLVVGENKAKTLQTVLEGEFQPDRFPAQAVKPAAGPADWLIDEAAAGFLNRSLFDGK